MRAFAAAFVLAGVIGCSGKLPETRYYQLAAPDARDTRAKAASTSPDILVVLEPLATDAAYDDERIVYRTTPYRLDYYQYHRWSASPGVMIGNFLERALEKTGKFTGVVRELASNATVVVGGRVVAIEEVDRSRTEWYGRLVIELTLSDARTGAPLWSQQYEELERMPAQSPEGLARALSTAMTRIARRATPQIAARAERQARLHAEDGDARSAADNHPRRK